MRITFLHMGAESLGIEYLSSCLKQKGHEVNLVFDPAIFNDQRLFSSQKLYKIFNNSSRLIRNVLKSEPDLVAFSAFTNNYQWACGLAERIKKYIPVPIIFGGIHSTSCPEEVIKQEFIDTVCIGDGEEALLELVESLERGEENYNIKNLWFKKDGQIIKNDIRPLVDNLDSIPFPDKELFEKYISFQDQYIIMTARKCPFNCFYCSNNHLQKIYRGKGKFLSRRSPDNVIEELKWANERYHPKEIIFFDDVFTSDMSWLEEFFNRYVNEIAIPYRCLSHPVFLSEDVVSLLKKTNCLCIQLGVQTLNENTRREIINRHETNDKLKAIFDLCDRYHLEYNIDHIFGLPFESEKDYIEAAEFYIDRKCCTEINTCWLSYFPNTEIVNIAINNGLLNSGDIEDMRKGKIKTYLNGGSITDKKLIRICTNFSLFFKMIPILPRKISKIILKYSLYRFFYIFSLFLGLPIRFISMLKARDRRMINYMKYYLNNFKRNIYG